MVKRGSVRQRAVLQYPSHWFEPAELLTFIELRPFTRWWERLNLSDLDLQALQILIMAGPKDGTVMEGTGGIRKVRFAPPGWRAGKSGALRVCYVYIEEVATVILAIVYPKSEKDDLNDKEKTLLRDAVERVKQMLLSRSYRCRPKSGAEDQ